MPVTVDDALRHCADVTGDTDIVAAVLRQQAEQKAQDERWRLGKSAPEMLALLKEADSLNTYGDNVLLSPDWFQRVRDLLKNLS